MLRNMAVVVCLLALCNSLYAQKSVNPPIDEDTIVAYQKLGAVYGGFKTSGLGVIEFYTGEEAAKSSLPGFRFDKLPKDGLPRLRNANVPFEALRATLCQSS